MTFAAGAQEQIRLIEEVTEGTTPATDMKIIPHSDVTGPSKEWDRGPTAEVASDLQVQSNPVKGFSVAMSISTLLRYGIADDLFELLCNSTWSAAAAVTAQTDVASVDTGNKFTSVTTDKFNAFAVGDVVYVFRDGSAPLDTWAEVTSVVTGASPELGINVNWIDLGDEAAGDSVTIMHSGQLTPGTTLASASIERAKTDIAQFMIGRGMKVSQLAFSASKGGDPTLAWTLMGLTKASAATTFGTGTETAAAVNEVMNAGDGFQNFREADVVTANHIISQFNFTIGSPIGVIDAMGSLGANSLIKNRYAVSGEYRLYTNDEARTLAQKGEADTASSVGCAFREANDGYYFHFPAIDYTSGDDDGSGNDNQIFTAMPWLAYKDGTNSRMFQIARFTSIPTS